MLRLFKSPVFPMNIRLFILLLLLSFSSVAQLKIPDHGGVWVHDEANVLSASAKAELEAILKYERDSTSNQIAILIIPSLNGESLEDFSLRVSEAWKLGQKDKDNGVLFIISIGDRLMRIESGSGLEGVLTDAMSSRINRNEVAPYFRQQNYDAGVKAGTLAIIGAIKGEYKNDAPVSFKKKSRRNSPLTTLVIIVVILIIISRRKKGGGGGGGYWSSGGGFMGPLGGGFGGSSGSWGGGGGGSDFGGGGGFSGGGSSDSW